MGNDTYLISKQLKRIANKVEIEIKKITGKKLAFTLIIFNENRAQYISSVERKESIKSLKILLHHWESETPDVPAHKLN